MDCLLLTRWYKDRDGRGLAEIRNANTGELLKTVNGWCWLSGMDIRRKHARAHRRRVRKFDTATWTVHAAHKLEALAIVNTITP
jgi:hypothetical protein